MTDAAWKPDPTGKHEFRYHDGTSWTDDVADAGKQSKSPWLPAASLPAPGRSATDRLKALRWWQWAPIALAVLVAIGAVSGGSDKADRTTSSAASAVATTAPATTAEPAATSAARTPAPESKPKTLSQRLKQNVIDINLEGEGKVKVETQPRGKRYDVLVYHELADNITGGLVQRGAELDAQRIMQNIYTGDERGRVQDVTVLSTGALIDKLGNESQGVAFSVSLPGSTGRRINWDNIDSIDIRKVWDVNLDIVK